MPHYTGVSQDDASFGSTTIVTNELDNVSNAQVRFRWTGDFAWGWAIDNVVVEEAPLCSATVAPSVVTTPTPADGATGVVTTGAVTFAWVVNPFGEAAESFNLSVGTNAAADNIGTLDGATSGNPVNIGAVANTTYFWKIDAVNCFGTTTSAIWSFTTAACTETAPPACTTLTAPADGDLAVSLDPTNQALTFTWDESDPSVTGYELFINGVSQGNRASGITLTGLPYNTDLTWSVVPSNCFGAATGCPTWSFTTEVDPACTETAPPACTTVIAPVDNESAAVTTENDDMGTISRAVAISWDAIVGADAYQITLDGVILGTTANTAINFIGLEHLTTYTWSIAPVNCFGVAIGCPTWTFTTDASLSVNDFETSSISYFYNKASDKLSLESDNASFTNIDLYNILGQQVITKKLSQTNETLNLSDLNDGIYIAKVSIGSKTKTIKFVKQ